MHNLARRTSGSKEEFGALESPSPCTVHMEAAGRKLLCPGTDIYLVSSSLQRCQLRCHEHLCAAR